MATMMQQMKRSWQAFRLSPPGMRFTERYHRRQRDTNGGWSPSRIAYIAAGLALVAGGLLLVPFPGPGWLVVFFGLALVGSEFKPVAEALDVTEIRLRVWGRAAMELWQEAPARERAMIVVVVAIVVLAIAYGLFVLVT